MMRSFFSVVASLFVTATVTTAISYPENVRIQASATLMPETFQYDSSNGIMLSSYKTGSIYTLTAEDNGNYSTEVYFENANLTSSAGFRTRNSKLYICHCNSDNTECGVMIVNMKTGNLIIDVDLSSHIRPDKNASDVSFFANDVVIDSSGDAYVTDTFQGVVYRVSSTDYSVEMFAYSDSFVVSGAYGVNGIALSADEDYLLVTVYSAGQLYKLSTNAAVPITDVTPIIVTNMDTDVLNGLDGSVMNDDKLYTVGGGSNVVFVFESDDDWVTAQVTDTYSTRHSQPTSVYFIGDSAYVGSAYFYDSTRTTYYTAVLWDADDDDDTYTFSKDEMYIISGVLAGVIIVLLLCFCCACCYARKKSKQLQAEKGFFFELANDTHL